VATPNDSASSGGTLALRPKTFGLFGMVLFSVSAILVADTAATSAAGAWVSTILCETGIILTLFLFVYFPMEGTLKAVFWAITGGGTIVSLLIGWWLYWPASRKAEA
jgi:hypothetical protein